MRLTSCLAATMALLGLAAAPARAEPVPGPAVTYCQNLMDDFSPRPFDLRTTDPAPPGGAAWGHIWIDKRPGGATTGYKVCVGHLNTPYTAGVKDYDGGTLGASAYAEYNQWNGSAWVRKQQVLATAKGVNAVSRYMSVFNIPIKDFKMGVCLYDTSGNGRYCKQEF